MPSVFVSLLPLVLAVAVGLAVPAFLVALLLARGRHASASSGGDRRGRVVAAAALVAGASGAVGMFLGAGPAEVAAASLFLTAPVLLWAVLAPWWPVRAVVAWAMFVTASVGVVATATARALESSMPWTALPTAGVGSALAVLVLGRLSGPFRRVLGIRAGVRRAVRTPLLVRPAFLRPAMALAVFCAALAVSGLTDEGRRPEAGSKSDGSPGAGMGSGARGTVDRTDARLVSADAGSLDGSARAATSAASTDRVQAAGPAWLDGQPAPTGVTAVRSGDTVNGSATAGTGTSPTDGSMEPADPTWSPTPSDPVDGLPGEPATGEVADTVEQVAEPVQDVVEETTEPVQDVVEETAGPVQEVVEETAGPVQDVVEETAGPVQDVVEETTEPVQDVVEETTGPVQDVVESTQQVQEGVEDTVDQVTDSVTPPLP